MTAESEQESRYRQEPITFDMGHYDLTVFEDKCMCGGCDTVTVRTASKDGSDVEVYNSEGPDATTLDVYDQVRELKRIVLDLAQALHKAKQPHPFVATARRLLALPEDELSALMAKTHVEPQASGQLADAETVRASYAGQDGCICRGNWREIVAESTPLLGRKYIGRDGKAYEFFGVVHSEDDYYYGMFSKDGHLNLLSCVGSIEGSGYTLQPETSQET